MREAIREPRVAIGRCEVVMKWRTAGIHMGVADDGVRRFLARTPGRRTRRSRHRRRRRRRRLPPRVKRAQHRPRRSAATASAPGCAA